MDWIKKHYDQFSLAVISAVMVLVFAIFLYLKTQSFGERFAEALRNRRKNDKVPPIVLDKIDTRLRPARQTRRVGRVNDPESVSERGSLFVSASLYARSERQADPSRERARFTRTA